MIFISHIGILYRVRHSNVKDMLIKKFSCGLTSSSQNCNLTIGNKLSLRRNTLSANSSEKSSLPHMLQRVSLNQKIKSFKRNFVLIYNRCEFWILNQRHNLKILDQNAFRQCSDRYLRFSVHYFTKFYLEYFFLDNLTKVQI